MSGNNSPKRLRRSTSKEGVGKTTVSKQNNPLDGIALSFDYFGAGPGCGGISALWIKSTNKGLRISICGDTTADDEPNVKLDIPSTSDWRDACRAIVSGT